MIWVAFLPVVTAILCGTLNAGTDSDKLSDIINAGEVDRNLKPAAWNATSLSQHISPAQSEFYIYVEGLEVGPDLKVRFNPGR